MDTYTLHVKLGRPTLTITDTRSQINEASHATKRLALEVTYAIGAFARRVGAL